MSIQSPGIEALDAAACSRTLDEAVKHWRPRTLRAIVTAALALGACASPAPNGAGMPKSSVDRAVPTPDAGALVNADAASSTSADASILGDAGVHPTLGPSKQPSSYKFRRANQRKDADGDRSASEAEFHRQVVAAKQYNRWAGVLESLENGAPPNVRILDVWPLITVIASYDAERQVAAMGRPAPRRSPKQGVYRFRILRLLLGSGVGVEQRGPRGLTPLMVATRTRQLKIIRLLLSNGASISASDPSGRNVIFYPTGISKPETLKVMKLLVAAGADVNHRASGGVTALMDAALRDDKVMAQRLLLVGADLSLVDDKGRTAVEIATQRGHKNLAKYLETSAP